MVIFYCTLKLTVCPAWQPYFKISISPWNSKCAKS
uniref:Uncharacterized protein n=1 Tax=Anguilla anguilla TaxID=7936 RepID=A0A0E9W5Q5_ANGAN